MTVYLLNSPVLTAHGTFTYTAISAEEAKELLQLVAAEGDQEVTSAVGHQSTASYMSQLLGLPIAVSRTSISMWPGDRAIIFRLKERPPEGAVLTLQELKAASSEWGLLSMDSSARIKELEADAELSSLGSPAQPEPQAAFISYERSHLRFAARLRKDLQRAGVDAWIDTEGIEPHSADWSAKIEREIGRRSTFVLVASHEGSRSDSVAAELELAEHLADSDPHRRIVVIDLTDPTGEVSSRTPNRQRYRFGAGKYQDDLVRLLSRNTFGPVTLPLRTFEAIEAARNETNAHSLVEDLDGQTWKALANHRDFVQLPVDVTGYSETSLFLPADVPPVRPKSWGILLQHTGDPVVSGGSVAQVLASVNRRGEDPWLLVCAGHIPKEGQARYTIPFGTDSKHVFDTVLEASHRAIEDHRALFEEHRLYIQSLAALSYRLGERVRSLPPTRVYHFDRSSPEGYIEV